MLDHCNVARAAHIGHFAHQKRGVSIGRLASMERVHLMHAIDELATDCAIGGAAHFASCVVPVDHTQRFVEGFTLLFKILIY